MTIDQRGRQAGASVRAQLDRIDVDGSLDALLVSVRRRQYLRTAAAVAAVAAVVIGGLTVRDAVTRADVPPTSDTPSIGPTGQCQQAFLQCEAGGRYTVRMQTQVTWTQPRSFAPQLDYLTGPHGDHAVMVQAYRRGQHIAAGVVVADPVFAARVVGPSGGGSFFEGLKAVAPDRSVGRGAHALAVWLSQRPYLIASAVERATIDGHPAWTVEVRLRNPGRPAVAFCNGWHCTPLLSIAEGSVRRTLGIWDDAISRYTFFDLGGADGTTAIWSFSFDGEKALAVNQALIDTIHFDGG
jgi:hypothetical protein